MIHGTLVRRRVPRHPVVTSFDRLLADIYRRPFGFATSSFTPVRRAVRRRAVPVFDPRLSAEELENDYRVVAEVPGIEAADLDISVEDNVLTIKGARGFEAAPGARQVAGSETRGDSGSEAQVEAHTDAEACAEKNAEVAVDAAESTARATAMFERKLRFPKHIVEDAVVASLRNGILTVTLPKRLEAAPDVRSIPVETA